MSEARSPRVLVAVCATASVDLVGPRARSALDPGQQARMRRLVRPADREDFLAARVLAGELVDELRGGDEARFTQRCVTCGGPHGRPEVVGEPGVHVSWAHAGGLVAAACSTRPVGVDVEWVPPGEAPPLAPAGPSDPVAAWLGWTRLEALVKRGDADLDTALAWRLGGPPSAAGIDVRLLAPGAGEGLLSDVVDPGGRWVASVAGAGPARWRTRGLRQAPIRTIDTSP